MIARMEQLRPVRRQGSSGALAIATVALERISHFDTLAAIPV